MSDYDELTSLLASGAGAAFGVVFSFLIAALAITITCYIVSSIAYGRVMKACSYSHPAAAWVPFWREWALASCTVRENETVSLFGVDVPAIVIKLWWLIQLVLNYIPYVGGILALIVGVIAQSWIFSTLFAALENKEKSDCTLIGVVASFFNIVAWVKFLQDTKASAL